jgi:hypothetical protein
MRCSQPRPRSHDQIRAANGVDEYAVLASDCLATTTRFAPMTAVNEYAVLASDCLATTTRFVPLTARDEYAVLASECLGGTSAWRR